MYLWRDKWFHMALQLCPEAAGVAGAPRPVVKPDPGSGPRAPGDPGCKAGGSRAVGAHGKSEI